MRQDKILGGRQKPALFAAAFGIGLLAAGFAADSRPAEAAIVYPWCARARISEVGSPSCGFSSYEQCVAANDGIAGGCVQNPFYDGPASDAPGAAARRGQRPSVR